MRSKHKNLTFYPFSFFLAVTLHLIIFGSLFFSWGKTATTAVSIPYISVMKVATLTSYHPKVEVVPPASISPQKQVPSKVLKDSKIDVVEQHQPNLSRPTIKASPIKKIPIKPQANTAFESSKNLLDNAVKKATANIIPPKKIEDKKFTQQLLQDEIKQVTTTQTVTSANQPMIDKYKVLIIQAIGQQWILPLDLEKNLETQLIITIAPGGMVLKVTLEKTSGNTLLDRSAEIAVYKASPLPVPLGKEFDNFRVIHLTVRPEGMLDH